MTKYKIKKRKDIFIKYQYICPSCGTKKITKIPKANIHYYTKKVEEKDVFISITICRKCHIKGANLYDYSLLDSSFLVSFLYPIKIDKCYECGKKTKELFIIARNDEYMASSGSIVCRECGEVGTERGYIDKNIKVFS